MYVCVWGVEIVMGPSRVPSCHHHLIQHPNGRGSYSSKQETNESEAARERGEKESENDILEKNGVHYRVTGFQETIKGF